jgi:hypothetical protein
MAEEHRRDLSILGGAAEQVPGDVAVPASPGSGIGSGTHPSVERHPIGQHVGTLLIRVGTRLGGATMRTS